MNRIGVIGTAVVFLVVGAIAPALAQKDDHKDGGKPGQDQQKQQGKPEQQQRPQQAAPAQQQHEQQSQQSHPAQQQRAEQPQQSRPAQQQHTQQAQQSKPTQQQNTPQAQQSRPAQQQHSQQSQPAQQQRAQQTQQSRPGPQQQQATRSAQLRNPVQVRQEQAAWKGDRANNWKSDHRTWQQRGGYNGYRVPDNSFRAYYGVSHQFRIYSLPVLFVGGQQRFQYGGVWFGLVDPWPEYWSSNWYDDDDVYVDFYDGGYYLTDRRYPSDRIAVSFYLN
jgi:hypothetical protein